jgi:glycolate oxidase
MTQADERLSDPPAVQADQFLLGLADFLPQDRLITDEARLGAYRHDQALLVEAGMPIAAALPIETAEVSRILRLATRHRISVVPRGAGTGLSGGANATDGALVIGLAKMDRILEIDTDSQVAVVQPGVINAAVRREAATRGLWYAADPASFEISSIGGNVATNAGGLNCVKYGVTRQSVLGLEVVLADGTILRTGGRTVKQAAGYDLTGLFVGSEGTLAVITEITLRLRPIPHPPATVVAFFESLEKAGDAVLALGRNGILPSVLELLDQTTMRAVETWKRLGLNTDAAAMLLAQSDAAADSQAEAQRISAIWTEAGATDIYQANDPAEAELLMGARRLAFHAIERLGPTILEDVGVPRGRTPALLRGIVEIGERHGVTIATFGHAGDGNFHPTVIMQSGDETSRMSADAAAGAIMRLAVSLGGTVTGEHGIGLFKRPYLELDIGPEAVQTLRTIKTALDPLGILNPGKAI